MIISIRLRYTLFALLGLAAGACTLDATEGQGSGDEATVDDSIIRGDTAVPAHQRDRTVHVRTPQGGICSGTILLPNVVLTARHCVTTDGTIAGPIAAADQVRARLGGLAPGPAVPDFCTGAGRDPTCARGNNIQQLGGTAVDAVVVGMENSISLANDVTISRVPFVPLELRTPDSAYLNTNRLATGWGRNNCAGGSGTLRSGTMTINAVNVTTGSGTGMIQIAPGPTGQGLWRGDSGGPTWGTATQPPGVIGVHSVGSCTATDTAQNGFDVSLSVNQRAVQAALTALMPANTLRDLSNLNQVTLTSAAGQPVWIIRSGRLTQTADTRQNLALLDGLAYQRLAPTEYTVNVLGSDDDYSGIVLSYYNNNDYLRCDASEQNDHVRLVARRGGVETVLASAAWAGDYGATVTFRVTNTRVAATNRYPVRCEVSGGGAVTVAVTGEFDVLSAGRAGVYNDFNDETSYFNFNVRRL